MTEFAITSGQLMWLCTLIAGLWSVIKIIKEIRKPNDDLKRLLIGTASFSTTTINALKNTKNQTA